MAEKREMDLKLAGENAILEKKRRLIEERNLKNLYPEPVSKIFGLNRIGRQA